MLGSRVGQATVEAAALIPTLGMLLVLLLEPCCVLYTRTVMLEAVSEAARVAATVPEDELEGIVGAYVKRRLKAVPEVPALHVGGSDDWQVRATRSDGGKSVEVSVTGHLRPLPVAGLAFAALGTIDDAGLVVEASAQQDVRPSWLGGEYGSWIEVWG